MQCTYRSEQIQTTHKNYSRIGGKFWCYSEDSEERGKEREKETTKNKGLKEPKLLHYLKYSRNP